MKASRKLLCLTPLAALLAAGSAFATDGYFPIGYGMKAMGMGGASVAMSDDAFAGANNPAAAAWAGNRVEGGLSAFMPKRGMSRSGGMVDAAVDSDSNLFLVPEIGFNKAVNDKLGVGITVYGNGGMNTNYDGGQLNCGQGPANVLCGGGRLGMDLMQLIVAPTVAYKVNDQHSFGVSPLLVYQQFKAFGLQAFSPMSQDPSHLTDQGYSRSTGAGVRLGYMGKLSDSLSVGASYSPKIKMGKFDKYAGLFAGGGSFDIPENYALGLSFKATPTVLLALDYERINYAGVPSIANPSNVMAPLGSSGGPGFGWLDVNVWKLGVQWEAMPGLTLRAGYNRTDNPVQSRDVSFNIIAPGVVTTHFTLGGTYALSPTMDLTVAYMHAQNNSVTGASMFNAQMPAGNETIRMYQDSLGVQVGWRW